MMLHIDGSEHRWLGDDRRHELIVILDAWDVWRHLFGNPAVAAEAWTTFLDGPEEEVRRNAGRRSVPYNRVAWTVAWTVPVVTLRAGSPPG